MVEDPGLRSRRHRWPRIWSRLRQDSAFFSNPEPESKICEKTDPKSLFIFGSSRSLRDHDKCHCLKYEHCWIYGCIDHGRSLNRSRIHKFKKIRTRIRIKKFWNKSRVGVWKCGSGHLCPAYRLLHGWLIVWPLIIQPWNALSAQFFKGLNAHLHSLRRQGAMPPIFCKSSHFVLWEAVSQTKYCCSPKMKKNYPTKFFRAPKNLGWLRYWLAAILSHIFWYFVCGLPLARPVELEIRGESEFLRKEFFLVESNSKLSVMF